MAPQLRVMAITSRGPKINSYAHICKSSSREPKTLSDLLGHIQARAHKHTCRQISIHINVKDEEENEGGEAATTGHSEGLPELKTNVSS